MRIDPPGRPDDDIAWTPASLPARLWLRLMAEALSLRLSLVTDATEDEMSFRIIVP